MDSIDTTQIIKPGLERIEALLAELGDPQNCLRFVHVVGTNGKGSICAFLSAMLQAAGYRTGCFTSPALECARDAVTVDGVAMSEAGWEDVSQSVRSAASRVTERLGDEPSPFETECAMAIEHFRRSGCDICVMEAGMGGALDATNAVHPDVLVIARIGFDHMAYLGDTLAAIAAQKVGAAKPGSHVVSWPQQREAMQVIEDVCGTRGCALTQADFPRLRAEAIDGVHLVRRFDYKDQRLVTPMLGSCQPQNASVAIETAFALRRCGWNIPDRAIRDGIACAALPARFEVLGTSPLAIVDAAHNPQGAQALAASLTELLRAIGHPDLHACMVMGVLADKDYESMIAALMPMAASFVTYAPDSTRALSASDLAAAVSRQAPGGMQVNQAPDAKAATALALRSVSSDGCVVAFGSLYSAADVRRIMLSA